MVMFACFAWAFWHLMLVYAWNSAVTTLGSFVCCMVYILKLHGVYLHVARCVFACCKCAYCCMISTPPVIACLAYCEMHMLHVFFILVSRMSLHGPFRAKDRLYFSCSFILLYVTWLICMLFIHIYLIKMYLADLKFVTNFWYGRIFISYNFLLCINVR